MMDRGYAIPKSDLHGRAIVIPLPIVPTWYVRFLCSFMSSGFHLYYAIDYVIYHLSHESSRLFALILLGSSYVIHTYQVRPFSNSTESVLVAISLLLLRKLLLTESLRRGIKVCMTSSPSINAPLTLS